VELYPEAVVKKVESGLFDEESELSRVIEIINESIMGSKSRVVLWPDKERQWEKAIPVLRKGLPGLLCLGQYDPDNKTGPAIWLRCSIAGKVKDLGLTEETFFVIYLPGVSIQEIKAVENCPEAIKPLAELQFRSAIWSQYNGKDWTILSYLVSDKGGLGLDVAQDTGTKQALQNALLPLLQENIEDLKGKRLEKDHFNSLLTGGDPTRDMLNWLDRGDEFKANLSLEQWQAFCANCKSHFGIDPVKDGLLSAAKSLVETGGTDAKHKNWQLVWDRYCDAPQKFSRIPDLIRKLQVPDDWMYLQNEDQVFDRYPQWNDEMERILHKALESLYTANAKTSRIKIAELETDHARRRELIWAELGEAKYAELLQYLAQLAKLTDNSLERGDLSELEKRYSEHLWQTDGSVLQLLGKIDSGEDLRLFGGILDLLYLPWVEASARYLQKRGVYSVSGEAVNADYLDSAEVVLFLDGLRFDCAKRLSELLRADGWQTGESVRWTGLPTTTATCKPILIEGILNANTDKQSRDSINYEAMSSYEFKKALEKNNYRVLGSKDIIPQANHENWNLKSKLWLEYGNLDELGHSQGWGLAKHIESTLAEIAVRIKDIFKAGWESVLIVTDHGWLISPTGLPKTDLSACLSESKWHRFATLKEGAQTQDNLFPWYWDPLQQIAMADGVSCYSAGVEYTHGGLSLQECLLLDIKVTQGKNELSKAAVRITDIKWTNMRCSIAIEGQGNDLVLDIRTSPDDLTSSVVLSVKSIKSNHTASVVVENENLQGDPAYIVILDQDYNIITQIQTTIGGGKDDPAG